MACVWGGGALAGVILFADVNGGAPVVVQRVVGAPIGRPAAEASVVQLPQAVELVEGALIDLSASFDILVAPLLLDAVLPAQPL